MFYTYILQSQKDKKLYIGFTTNLKRRIKEHASGKSKATAPRRPLKLLYYEAHLSEQDSRRREKYFKTTKGKSSFKQMIRSSLKEIGS